MASTIRGLVNLKERNFTIATDGVEKKFKIVKPNFIQGNKADLVYKAAFNEALRAGVPTAVQLKEYLDGNEYFSKSSSDLQKIDQDIIIETSKLEDLKTEEEATPVILSVKELRARRMLENYKLNSVYENTCETYAEGVRNQFYTSELMRDEAGVKVFKSFDDFKEKISDALAQEGMMNVMIFNARLSDNYQMEYEENKWMLKMGLINEKGEYVGKVEKTEPVEGNIKKEEASEVVSG